LQAEAADQRKIFRSWRGKRLERNQSKRALASRIQGGFFLMKKPLGGLAPGDSYSGFTMARE
jgi:hypothetical protein